MSNKMTGAQILIEMLVREKVDVLFGYPGGQVLPIFDKLYDSPLKFILTRHEQGAAHAADGYARASGKPVVVCTVGGEFNQILVKMLEEDQILSYITPRELLMQ